MAYTQEQLDALGAVFDGLPVEVQALMGSQSTAATSAAISQIIAQRRQQSMSLTISGLITGAVSNWDGLDAAGEVADGATIYDALAAFTAAKTARNANEMLAHAVSFALASKKHLGV
jgi:hypothetical protein